MQNQTGPVKKFVTADQLLAVIKQLVDELHPNYEGSANIGLDSSLYRDLGFDSLTRVELLARLEHTFDLSLSEQVLTSAETPRDFLRFVLGADSRTQSVFLPETEKAQLAAVEIVPQNAATLIQIFQWHVSKNPDRTHVRFYSDDGEGKVVTYRDLWQGAEQVAAGLQYYGLAHGGSVLIMLPTSLDYFVCFLGILMAGGVPVPMYPPGRLKQIEEHLRRHAAIAANSLAQLMITVPEAKRFAKLMLQQTTSLERVLTLDELTVAAGSQKMTSFPALAGKDTAFLQYTSGSTGMPKGVVLTHANLLANIRAMGRTVKVTSNDIFVSWLPLYHDMGLIGAWLGSLYYACPMIVMSPLAFIARPERWLKAIHRYRGTLSAAPNFAYELCQRRVNDKDIKGLDLSSWRCAFNGAEAVSPKTIMRFSERFGRFGFRAEAMMPVYGLAESSVGLAFPPLNQVPKVDLVKRRLFMSSGKAEVAAADDKIIKFVSCGQPLPGHQIRIVDNSNRELADRQEGRLQFKGPSSTSGYFRNFIKTSDLFSGQWLESGDMAYIADGEVYITGRSKDIIIRAGRNIYPEELEEAIGRIEGVSKNNVAVFGIIDTDSGTERFVVLAETRKRKVESLAALRNAINTSVNDLTGTLPDEVVLAPPNTVLKTSSGKIRRAASRALYERGDIGKSQQAVWRQVARFAMAGAIPRLQRLCNRLAATFYAAYSWFLFGLAASFAWCAAVVLPRESWRWTSIRLVLRFVFRLAGIRISGQVADDLSLPDVPCVFVANHASYLDSIILFAVLPRCFSFVAKSELKNNFFVRTGLQRLGTEFVDRFEQQKGVDDARRLIDRGLVGRSLLFFAEGTLMRMPGLLPFRLGAFETAIKGNLPVVPIAIRGTRSILRSNSWFPRRGAASVLVGESMEAATFLRKANDNHFSATLLLRDQVRAWILRHCREPDLEHERPPIFETS